MRRRFTWSLLLAASLLASAAMPAAGASRPPRLLRFDDTTRFAVRPATLAFGVDGGLLVLGPDVSKSEFHAGHDGHIRWKSWNPKIGASGVGTVWINQCRPDCAAGHYSSQPAAMMATNVVGGRYTQVVLSYGAGGRPTVRTYHLKRFGRLYGWQ
jgi:hypothetical protein